MFEISNFYVTFGFSRNGAPLQVERLPIKEEMWFKDAFSPDSTLGSIVRFENDGIVWDKLLVIDKILGTGNPNRTRIFPRGGVSHTSFDRLGGEKSPRLSPFGYA